MSNELTDREIVDAIRSQIPSKVALAIRALYRHKGIVVSFIKADGQRELLDDEFIKDIFQDSLLIFLKKVLHHGYEPGEATISTYLHKICHYRYLSERKQIIRRMEREADYIRQEETQPTQADEALFEVEQYALAEEILHQLKPEERQLIQWYDFEQLSHREIGEQLGITEDAAKQRYYRARLSLTKILKRYEVYR